MSLFDAVDGFHHRHRNVPKCDVIRKATNVVLWLNPAVKDRGAKRLMPPIADMEGKSALTHRTSARKVSDPKILVSRLQSGTTTPNRPPSGGYGATSRKPAPM